MTSSSFSSQKCEYAKKWQIPIVNFLWLEDCFLHQCLVPMISERYKNPDIMRRRVGARKVMLPGMKCIEETVVKPRAECLPLQPVQCPLSTYKARRRSASLSTTRCPQDKKQRMLVEHQHESFKSVSTSHDDDTQQIRDVRRVYDEAAGIPHLRSMEGL